MFTHILVPIDGESLSHKALKQALSMASVYHAKLTMITVVHTYPPIYAGDGYMFNPLTDTQWKEAIAEQVRHWQEAAEKIVEKFNVKQQEANRVVAKFLVSEDESPYKAIIAAANKRKCDLIVMASHGRRGISALVLGSETQKVLTHTSLPVLVCR
jgi:nucleotide-binding universal stress UspA family protein